MITPTKIVLNEQKDTLLITFEKKEFSLSAEFLRVHSPSAETRGHSKESATLEHGKKDIIITDIKPVGNYAITIFFSDGHCTGIYSWQYLYSIAKNYDNLWYIYLDKLKKASLSRDTIKAKQIL